MPEQSAAVVIPEDERELRGLELAERHFPDARRKQVGAYLGVKHDDPAMLPFLAVCASLNLSPISGHVWLLPQRNVSRDGDDQAVIYRPAIGRDGLLHKAHQTRGKPGGYKGMKWGVVCERDDFEVTEDGTLDGPTLLHRFATKPTEFPPDADPSRYRGRVIGAWAKCFIDGEPPVFYYAPVHEHAQLRQVMAWNEDKRVVEPLYRHPRGGTTFEPFTRIEGAGAERNEPVVEFDGTWEYLSGMISKCAQSYVLRVGLGVTGVVPVDELRGGRLAPVDAPDAVVTTAAAGFEDVAAFDVRSFLGHVDEALRERLASAVEAANVRDPFAWGPAKCEMVMKGRSAEQLAAVAEQIEQENERRQRREEAVVPDPPSTRPPAPDLSDEDRARKVSALRARQTKLTDGHKRARADNRVRIRAELDGVEAELRQLGEEV